MGIELSDLHECMGNPYKLRVLLLLKHHGPMTAKQMLAESDIPQTTLYRILGWMEDRGILAVVSETKVRAMTEKTYDTSEAMKNFSVDTIMDNDLDGYCKAFNAFVFNLMREFERYSHVDGADISRDGPDFAGVTVYTTGDELRTLMDGIRRLVAPYLVRRSEDQETHTLAIVVTPPREGPE